MTLLPNMHCFSIFHRCPILIFSGKIIYGCYFPLVFYYYLLFQMQSKVDFWMNELKLKFNPQYMLFEILQSGSFDSNHCYSVLSECHPGLSKTCWHTLKQNDLLPLHEWQHHLSNLISKHCVSLVKQRHMHKVWQLCLSSHKKMCLIHAEEMLHGCTGAIFMFLEEFTPKYPLTYTCMSFKTQKDFFFLACPSCSFPIQWMWMVTMAVKQDFQ